MDFSQSARDEAEAKPPAMKMRNELELRKQPVDRTSGPPSYSELAIASNNNNTDHLGNGDDIIIETLIEPSLDDIIIDIEDTDMVICSESSSFDNHGKQNTDQMILRHHQREGLQIEASQARGEDKMDSTVNSLSSTSPSAKRAVAFDSVYIYYFPRSQGFSSIPSQGGSTLGMTNKHSKRRKLSVDLFEEVRRRTRREILLSIKFGKRRRSRRLASASSSSSEEQFDQHSNSNSSSSTTSSTSDDDDEVQIDDDDDSLSEFSDISDSELENDSFVFLQPIGVKTRRSLLRASGVGRIDPIEKRECKKIRESRERTGCKCVDRCVPGQCECSILGVNCHVDRISFPCGCISSGCQNPLGRTEFDTERVKGHCYNRLVAESLSDDKMPDQFFADESNTS